MENRVLRCFFVLSLLAAGAAAAPKSLAPSPAARAHGVTSFSVVRADEVVVAQLASEEPGVDGALVSYATSDEGREMVITAGDLSRSVVWEPQLGRITMRADGREEVLQFDFESLTWDRRISETSFAADERVMLAGAAVMADLEEHDVLPRFGKHFEVLVHKKPALEKSPNVSTPEVPQPWDPGFGGATSNCNMSLESRGMGTGSTRTSACYEAHKDVTLQCWNQYCAGCCYYGPCDAACGIGDYFCMAGQSGFPCKSY